MKAIFKLLFLIFSPILFAQNPVQLDSLLKQGIKARSNNEYTKSLELLTKVRTIAEENSWYKQHFLAINNIGANYYSMLDYGEALDNYLEAYTIALKHLDKNEEMIVLNNIAILYSKEGDFDKAEEYFSKAYVLAQEQNDSFKIGLYAINLGIVANQQNKLDVAAKYLSKAQEVLDADSAIYVLIAIALAENQYKSGNLVAARSIALNTLPQLESISFNEDRISILILLSNIALDLGENSNAIGYAEEALKASKNLENRINAHKQLAKVSIQTGSYKNALSAKDSIINLKDSLNILKNGRLFENNKVKFEIADYRRELQRNRELQIQERTTLYSLLGISVLIIILIVWAMYNNIIKNKQRRILDQQNKEFIELELQKKESDNLLLEKQLQSKEAKALLKEERFKNELENRNRQLAAKALQISARNELIKEVISRLSDQTEIARNAFLSAKVKELNKLLKNDSEWDSFLTHFEEVNHGMLTNLRSLHPELTANDIRFLCYLYMNLTTKEIASLFNITVEAVRKRKERISNKIGLADSGGLYGYITGL